jgi:hypothetical protein
MSFPAASNRRRMMKTRRFRVAFRYRSASLINASSLATAAAFLGAVRCQPERIQVDFFDSVSGLALRVGNAG